MRAYKTTPLTGYRFLIQRRQFFIWWTRQRHDNYHDAWKAFFWCQARFPYRYRLVMEKI